MEEAGVTIVQSSSDDTSDDEADRLRTRCDSSGAEVKGDSDYVP